MNLKTHWPALTSLILTALLTQCSTNGLNHTKEGKICGGIAGIKCEAGLVCRIKAKHPDAQGICVNNKNSVLIMKVSKVSLALQKSNPPTLVIIAKGRVNTGGWTNIHLQPRVYVKAPADGIYEYEFKGVKPTGIATQAIVNVEARANIHNPNAKKIKGIRVISSSNSILKRRK